MELLEAPTDLLMIVDRVICPELRVLARKLYPQTWETNLQFDNLALLTDDSHHVMQL